MRLLPFTLATLLFNAAMTLAGGCDKDTPLKDQVHRRSSNQLLEKGEPAAQSPEASLHSIQPRPGFQVELVAAEPLVQDPIAFAWGPDGKLWVVEMGDYPLGVDGKGKPGGRVKYLESTKGDGKYDKATVFLDSLNFPTGVMPWRKGVLVTCAPEIFYAEDTKGTGKADLRVPLFTGFKEGNQQHRVNSLVWGLDNWIYCANGDSGGRVKSVKTGAVVDLRGHDFRIRPDEGLIDLQSGQTQYGRSRDDWGNWFGCNNSNPMYHYVLADHYLRRNPHIAGPDPRVPVSVTPGAAQVFPISRTLPRFNDPKEANHFTSACSAIVYRDDLFGPAFSNSTFVSEPVHNLIHREIITPQGVTFSSRRAPDELSSEFLASSDNWFRPTMIQTGPDGALWIADMYRQVIEHPEWIPKDWQKRLDLRAGHDKGRIYRVYPVGAKPRAIPRLDKLTALDLVNALDSPSGWQRDMAQQLLLERRDPAVVPALEKMARAHTRPLARLHALVTLDGLNRLTPAVLAAALNDPHPGVRRHAVRLYETPALASAEGMTVLMLKLVSDPDPQVRMQVAYMLGELEKQFGGVLGRLAVQEAGDRYLLAAVMSSVNAKNLNFVLRAVMASSRGKAPPAVLLDSLLRLAFAFNDTMVLADLLNALATPEDGKYVPWQFSALAGLLDALDNRNQPLGKLKEAGGELRNAVTRLGDLFDAARAVVADTESSPTDLVHAARLLGRGLDHQQDDLRMLATLLTPQTADAVQLAAVASLGHVGDPHVPELLLRGWKGYSPALRSQVLEVLFRRDDWVKAALDAVEKKQVLALELDAFRRQRLLTHRTLSIRERAGKLFIDAITPDRQKVLDSYRSVLSTQGDATRGAQVFGKTCATCHRFNNVGHEVGPDLASVGDKSPEGLLIAILDPNRAVEARYINYYATKKNGLTYTGVLTGETGTTITLTAPEGKQQVILRTDLDTLTSTDKSAMPEGLEKDLKPQDVADVIAYLRAGLPQSKPKVFEGNKPELVRPETDGSLRLLAANCEIYGTTLVLEKQYGNLGFWSSEDDRAVWTVDVSKAGKYSVWFDWACEDSAAGNSFVLQAGLERLAGKVPGTGSWDVYRQARLGEIRLQAGRQQLTLRSDGKVSLAMMDLKSIKLVPAGEK